MNPGAGLARTPSRGRGGPGGVSPRLTNLGWRIPGPPNPGPPNPGRPGQAAGSAAVIPARTVPGVAVPRRRRLAGPGGPRLVLGHPAGVQAVRYRPARHLRRPDRRRRMHRRLIREQARWTRPGLRRLATPSARRTRRQLHLGGLTFRQLTGPPPRNLGQPVPGQPPVGPMTCVPAPRPRSPRRHPFQAGRQPPSPASTMTSGTG